MSGHDSPIMASLLHDSFGQCSPESAEAQTRGPHLWPSLLQDVYRPDDRPSNCGACRGPQVTGRLGLEENSLSRRLLLIGRIVDGRSRDCYLKLCRLSQFHEVWCEQWWRWCSRIWLLLPALVLSLSNVGVNPLLGLRLQQVKRQT